MHKIVFITEIPVPLFPIPLPAFLAVPSNFHAPTVVSKHGVTQMLLAFCVDCAFLNRGMSFVL